MGLGQQFFVFIFILISALCVKNGFSIIPEASQEGPLYSFKSYQDVVMFHYSVPKQVLRATWQFTAFMDHVKCPQRKVHIFLKWGSYPVIYINNATFPSQMYIQQNSTIETSTVTIFEPKSMTILPIYSPEPGDWFVGAYLSPWDEKVHQQGIGHKCHYSLGSVALWTETNNVHNIPLNQQIIIKTTETISYYKIFIPMDTWSFQLDIWGCNFTLKTAKNFHGTCIKNLKLEGRVLPYYNHSNSGSTVNLTSMDSHTFNELSPFQDAWYYLMVVSTSPINFYVKVTVVDCPVITIQDMFIRQYLNAPTTISKRFNLIHTKTFKEHSFDWSSNNLNELQQNTHDKDKPSMVQENSFNSCYPRHQLVRLKDTKAFSRNYLLRGSEWLTSWIVLTDTNPVIIQFDILPLIDIGGTLDFKFNMELNKVLIQQNINISICINRGRIPKHGDDAEKVDCDNGHFLQLSSNSYSNTSLLIPYPQPDVWFITLQATCYINRVPVRCKVEEILIFISVKLRACIFEGKNPCGEYGMCQEVRRGFLYYSACKCFAGRQGLACTDNTNAVSDLSILLMTLALTLSNLFFLPAIYLAFRRNHLTEGLIYTSTMLFSTFYHACDQQSTNYCIVKFEVLQYCDFFSGMLSFWITLVSMANIPEKYTSFCHMLGAIIIAFGVESDKTGLFSNVLPIVLGSLLPIASYAYACFAMKKILWPKRIFNLIIGLLLVGFGMLLFCSVETESNYQYVHSFWHVIIALSLIFLLPPMKDGLEGTNHDEIPISKESPLGVTNNESEILRDNNLIPGIS